MKFDEDFGRFLALAAAIRRRDEVCVKQFAVQMATMLVEEFEINEAQKASPVRNAEARRRQEERLEQDMASYMERLRSLVDDDGMEWLRSQTTG